MAEGLELENSGAHGHVGTWEDRRLAASQLPASSLPRSDNECRVERAGVGTERIEARGREIPKGGGGVRSPGIVGECSTGRAEKVWYQGSV